MKSEEIKELSKESTKLFVKVKNLLSGERAVHCFMAMYILSKYYEMKLHQLNPEQFMTMKTTVDNHKDEFFKVLDENIIEENDS